MASYASHLTSPQLTASPHTQNRYWFRFTGPPILHIQDRWIIMEKTTIKKQNFTENKTDYVPSRL